MAMLEGEIAIFEHFGGRGGEFWGLLGLCFAKKAGRGWGQEEQQARYLSNSIVESS